MTTVTIPAVPTNPAPQTFTGIGLDDFDAYALGWRKRDAALLARIKELETPVNPVPALTLGHWAGHGTGTWTQRVAAVEAKFGKFAGAQHVYWGVGSSGQLSAELKTWLDADPTHKLFANWKPWLSGQTWRNLAGGARDSAIAAAADTWAPYAGRVFVTIGHEPENDGQPSADYVAMWQHIAPIIAAHAPGVARVWTMMGPFSGAGRDTAWYTQWWPGAEHVDVIGHDPYIVAERVASQLPVNILNGASVLRALPGASALPVIAAEWGADLGGNTAPYPTGDRGTDQHRADAIAAVQARLADLVASGHIMLIFYDAGSDYLSATGPDVGAYQSLKDATEAL
jgi:hypothetical protein